MKDLRVRLCVVVCLLCCCALAQNPQSDPQALTYAAQAISALTGGAPIADATFTGDATWIAGSDKETGAATLYAKGMSESRLDLNLSGGTRTEVRNDTGDFPQGASVIGDSGQQAWAVHNCWVNASWFFPTLSALAATSDPALIFLYQGEESRNGVSVQHLQSFRYVPGKDPDMVVLIGKLSAIDIYLDAKTLLPVAMDFNVHPDSDALTNIAVEISYSDYRSFGGVLVPTRVQKSMSGSLALDVTITGASFNSGLPDSLFSIQ